MRLWDYQAAQKPDHFIAISHAVAARCQKYYRRNVAAVIYPPVDISKFQSHPELCFTKNRDYFLIVSRLVAHKHVSDAIEAFKQMPQEKLVIVGTGNHVSKLKRQALGCQNIIFKGKVTDAALSCLYHHAQALIFPQEEDFGITAVEAHASGTPVIAYNRGAAPEIISHGQTGILYAEQTPAAIINAVKKCQQQSLSAKDCYRNAQKFDKNEFTRQFNQTLERLCPNLKSQ
jgi:glycosyltransferase involved in cell wall biosynthesis